MARVQICRVSSTEVPKATPRLALPREESGQRRWWKTKPGTTLLWRRRRGRWRSLLTSGASLSSFGDGEKEGEGLLSTTAVEASPHPQVSGGQCAPLPAVVEFAAAHGWWKHEVDGNWIFFAQRELLQND
ncbi:hypothetical protein PIB30_061348 [Stylosanthes scabra]|uniref:Uncharacterized protein n=1 Tax=Stylosanthes scabra TaxID=79078 RepID=A0ABU6RKU7_9FABA|nr:hypothetical protein [Stylosanthes scabra]